MADFCKQCTIAIFAPDAGDAENNDMKGLSTEEDTKNKLYAIALCEGCGPTLVDHTGACVRWGCDEGHGTVRCKEEQEEAVKDLEVCPKCNNTTIKTTLIGFSPLDPNPNTFSCYTEGCGWRGKVGALKKKDIGV